MKTIKSMKKTFLLSIFLIVLSQLMAGINVTSSKYLVTEMPLIFLLFARFVIGSVILFGFMISKGKHLQQVSEVKALSTKEWIMLIAQACCASILFNLLLLWGVQYTTASMAGIITSALPAMVTVLALFLLKQRLTRFKFLCVGFATIGLLIINISSFKMDAAPNALFGSFIILLALIPEALYYVLSKVMKIKLSSFTNAFIMNLINALLMVPLLFFVDLDQVANISEISWLVLIISGVASGLFYVFWMSGCKDIDGSTAGLMTALMPIFTLLLSWIFLNQGIGSIQAFGMMFILISIFFSTRKI
jgi:drug/metabolite transporter (DMT)-like permease